MKKHIQEIDILRGLACLAVVFVHLSAAPVVELPVGSPSMLAMVFLNRAVKFTTPVFIFVSGFLLTYTYEQRPFEYANFIVRRLKVLLGPYIVWSLMYAAAFVVMGKMPLDPIVILQKLVFADMNYHLYFVATITQCYLLFGVFRWLFERVNSKWLMSLLLAVNILFIVIGYFPYADRFFLKYVFFFALGIYFARERQWLFEIIKRHKHWCLGLYFGMCVFYGTHFYSTLAYKTNYLWYVEPLIWFFFCISAIPVLYLSSQRIVREHERSTRFLSKVSSASYYIYLAHPFVLYSMQFVLEKVGVEGILKRFILLLISVYTISIVCAVGYVGLKKKWRERQQ